MLSLAFDTGIRQYYYQQFRYDNLTSIHSGKTVLSSLIIEECQENSEFKTSYFYCREVDDTTATCMGVLRGLLAQVGSFYIHNAMFVYDTSLKLSLYIC